MLVNYTHKPISKLRIALPGVQDFGDVLTTDGVKVKAEHTPSGIKLELPLKWTDIVVLGKR